jgi:predicted MPP superfamily phosphohydrolase
MGIFLTLFILIIELGSVLSWLLIKLTILSNQPDIAHGLLLWFIWVPLIAIGSFTLSWNHYSTINAFIYRVTIWWLGALAYITIASIFVGILYSTGTKLGLNDTSVNSISLALYGIALMVALLGTVHARIGRVRTYTLEKKLFPPHWAGRRIALISDTHIGQVNGRGFLKKVISEIKAQNPNMVIIAGDLIDGPKFPIEWLDELDELTAPQGVYFVPGNHDEYSRVFHKVENILRSKMIVLNDEKAIVDGLQLVGIAYRKEKKEATKALLESLKLEKDVPSIVVLHDPKNVQALIDHDVTLTLSGHTHKGQIFPGNLIVKKIYGKHGYGMSKTNNTVSVTSSGRGTAQSAMRVGSTPEIVILKIEE